MAAIAILQFRNMRHNDQAGKEKSKKIEIVLELRLIHREEVVALIV